ncbi:hypothetical protein DM860_015634 [Cuscuta australis]|uniref:Uncharacterized protein n=1 Tax=Cuscuta australis TaxID=267555 RepID=A0A328DFI0_9ASTE|nr:hypothetical protein DM860_015634 [Cuscuta australis]
MSLSEADEVLRLSKVPFTKEELGIVYSWRKNTRRALITGIGTGSVITWLVTGRLSTISRVGLATCAGISCGSWRWRKATLSIVEQSLSLNGTYLQRVVADGILKSLPNERAMKHFSKHFICENVYDESLSDKPEQRWRLRNSYGGNFDNFQKAEGDPYEDAISNSEGNPVKKANVGGDSFASKRKLQKKPDLENEMRSGGDHATSHPFDSIFGPLDNVDEISRPSLSPTPTPRQKHGRSRRRRHLMHHKEASQA